MTRILTGGTPADDRPDAVDPDAPRSRPSIRERTRQLVRIGGVLTLGGVAALATFHFGFMPIAVRHGHDVTVPKVTGLHFDDARRVLSDHGLEAQRVADRVSVEWNPGVVLEQSPTPGFHSREGRPIGLVVSLGRGEVGVPDVAGESYRHAELILTRLGLPVGRVSRTASPRPVDEVLEVSPPTGTALIRGRPVDLLLSTGTTPRAFVMPDFSGGDPEGVSRSLRREGFRAEIVYPVGSYSATGRIASHTPPPGHRVVVGDEIKLMVREGS